MRDFEPVTLPARRANRKRDVCTSIKLSTRSLNSVARARRYRQYFYRDNARACACETAEGEDVGELYSV